MTLVNSDSGFWEREDETPFNFWAILSVGWIGFFLSIILNVLLYKVHPSGVPFSLSHPKKMRVHVCGREYNLRKSSEGNARMCFLTLINFPDSDARADEEYGAVGFEDPEDGAPIKTGRSCFPKSICCYGGGGVNEGDSGDESAQPQTEVIRKRTCFTSKCCGGVNKEEEAVEESIQLQAQGLMFSIKMF